jgi:hypothetical protein
MKTRLSVSRTSVLITLALSLACPLNGQDSTRLFFNEFHLSITQTNVSNRNTENRIGFGLGVSRKFGKKKHFGAVLGLEYNLTRQLKYSVYGGHFYSYNEVIYTLGALTIPLKIRLVIGRKPGLILEAGGYGELIHYNRRHGTTVTSSPGQPIQKTEFSSGTDLSLLNYGPSLGTGIELPIATLTLILKAEYRTGQIDLGPSSATDIFNRYFRFSVGLRL